MDLVERLTPGAAVVLSGLQLTCAPVDGDMVECIAAHAAEVEAEYRPTAAR